MDRPSEAERDALISQFCGITNAPPAEAESALASNQWNLDAAVTMWFASQDEDMDDNASDEQDDYSAPAPASTSSASAGRTLGGDPAPPRPTATSSQPSNVPRQQAPQRGMRTLKDLQSASSSHGHDHDSDDDDEGQDMFAGGEKSGLAVQNPNHHQDQINSILERARRNVARPGGDDPEEPASRFSGRGQTLGGDDAPSRVIPDPNASRPRPAPRVHRTLHFWRDGFSIDDGPLYRFDDPANADHLRLINSGRAPLDLLNVEQGQEVDLEVHPHKNEDYVQPKKAYKPFSGTGQRLGSPTPGASISTTSNQFASSTSAASTTPTTSSASSSTPSVNVNESQPTLTLQIRLGDGTRLQSRFNTTHTIGNVYSFVDAASPASRQRAYALMTTFPSKELADKGVALGDMAEFKRGGVVVQKWK